MDENIKRILLNEKKIIEEMLEMENEEEERIFPYYIRIMKSYEARIIEATRILDTRFQRIINLLEKEEEKKNICPIIIEPDNKILSFNYLRDFIAGAIELIVIDPYFFSVQDSDIGEYSKEIIKVLGIKKKNLKKLTIIYNKKCGNSEKYKNIIKRELSKNKKAYIEKDTSIIHDRFIIKDKNKGLFVGTSLNGIGKSKYSLISDIKEDDLKELLKVLYKHKLISK